jgi:hypothetical protein
LKAAISATYVALSVTVVLLYSDNYKFALGQAQQQFQNYQNPTLGVSIQYPSDWELQEESNDKLRFIKQEGFVTSDLNVENQDESETTLAEYANTRVNELQAQRPGFQLISNEPTTVSNKPAQKVVYTFEREEDGKTNKVMRIWSTNEDRLYTLAYIAESSQYDRYLPTFQRMVDSFRIGDSDSESSTTQVQSSDGSSGDNNGGGNCDRISYPDPDICIPPYPPDLNCPDISYKNFQVTGPDPHGFDGDNDGIGCDSQGGGVTPPDNGDGTPPDNDNGCDPSYPDVCIRSPPPDLNCGDIPYKNFRVTGSDPHGFDRDNDGIGCDTANEDIPTLTPLTPPPTPTDYCEPLLVRPPQWEKECSHLGPYPYPGLVQTPTPTPPVTTPEPTPTTPTPPVDPNLLARSQPQPQCEFGIDPETGLCNTEDTSSEPGTPDPTITPEEEFSREEEPEGEVDEVPEEDPEEEPDNEPEGNGESNADSTFE